MIWSERNTKIHDQFTNYWSFFNENELKLSLYPVLYPEQDTAQDNMDYKTIWTRDVCLGACFEHTITNFVVLVWNGKILLITGFTGILHNAVWIISSVLPNGA